MVRIPVESSNIEAVAWDNDILYVQFKGGALYEYEKVPNVLFEEFLKAPSKGTFMNDNIKGKFNYKKLIA